MGYIRKALEKGYWNTLGLHAVLTTSLRFLSVLGGACVACCLFLSTTTMLLLLTAMFHGAQSSALMYRFDAENRGMEILHFDVLNSKMQEFGLTKMIC